MILKELQIQLAAGVKFFLMKDDMFSSFSFSIYYVYNLVSPGINLVLSGYRFLISVKKVKTMK